VKATRITKIMTRTGIVVRNLVPPQAKAEKVKAKAVAKAEKVKAKAVAKADKNNSNRN
jgi:hypothetical protein